VFVALVFHHAKRMPRIIFASVAWPDCTIFLHFISETARFSGEKITDRKMFDFSLQLLYEMFLILRI
jgi:hypothetical protein